MNTEIKLYLLVLKLKELYRGDMDKVEQFLYDTIKHTSNYKSFINEWLKERYIKISMSKETQVLLMRNAGYTYREIQEVTGRAPASIKYLLDTYDLKYNIDEDTQRELELIGVRMNELERKGVTL